MDTRSELEGAWKETVKEDYLNGTLRRKEISKPRSIGLSESSARPLLSFLRLECSLASLGRQYCQVNRFVDLFSALDTP